MGLAGAAQLLRIERHVQHIREGRVTKEFTEVAYVVTSFWPDESSALELLQRVRIHWTIENCQHHRRDRTQDEDRCQVRESTTARNLSLFRSLTIFLFERQRASPKGKSSLPDFELKVCRAPAPLIHRFMPDTS